MVEFKLKKKDERKDECFEILKTIVDPFLLSDIYFFPSLKQSSKFL